MISLVISLTTTPMMCAWLLRREVRVRAPNRAARALENVWTRILRSYEASLDWALSHKLLILLILATVIGLNVYLYVAIPKGFFPQQESRRLNGGLRADQSISADAMGQKLRQMERIIASDAAVQTVVGFTGGGRAGGGFLAAQLKPPNERPGVRPQAVIARLRPRLSRVTGVSIFLNPQQDLRMGGRGGNALYQYTLKSDNVGDLRAWTIKLTNELKRDPRLTDLDNDAQDNGVEAFVNVDRDSASRMGVTPRDVDNALYNSFGQRQIATLYEDVNQYSVVLENDRPFGAGPDALPNVRVPASSGGAASTAASPSTQPVATLFAPIAGRTPITPPSTAITSANPAIVAPFAPRGGGGGAGGAAIGWQSSGATGGASGGGAISTTPARTPYETASSGSLSPGGGPTAASGARTTSQAGRAGSVSIGGALLSNTPSAASIGGAAATSAGTGVGGGSTVSTISGASATNATTPGAATTASAAQANPGLRDSAGGSGVSTQPSRMVPLPALATVAQQSSPASVNHQDAELAATISFNLAPGRSLSDAQAAFTDAEARIAMPTNVRGSFQGTARSFQDQLKQEPMLILAALVAIYIVLGILYESLVHPITVLSTLPSAGVGAVVALLLFKMEFSIIALIGVFLLIGIVKKNAILIIDFALEAERARGLSATEAVREACLLRFRPILMTTLAAGLGALPLAIGFGEGSELRQPLGVAIVGGLIASQLLTLFTTPVVYIYLDRLRPRGKDERFLSRAGPAPEPPPIPAARPV
jgi:multidrug efflux pump subunit AcrB